MRGFIGLVVAAVLVIGVLVSAPVSAAPAKAILDQYIVVLKDGANAQSVAAVAGVQPTYVYAAAVNGFAATLNQGQLTALQHNPNVDYIEQDQEVSINTTQTVGSDLWGLDRIDQRSLPLSGTYTYNTTASNVTVYVISTGNYTTHSQFGGRATNVYDAFGGTGQDCYGLGTHVAGTIGGSTYGVAKAVRLRGVRVFDCNGSGTYSGIIAGMNYVANNATRPAVVVIPFAVPANPMIDSAATNLVNRGITVVVAAGDYNDLACNYSPARASGVLTLTASTRGDYYMPNANYGSCVELYAPGNSVQSAWIGSTSANRVISDTGSAAAHAGGVAALYLSINPSAAPATVNSWIINNALVGVIKNNPPNTPNRLLFKSTL